MRCGAKDSGGDDVSKADWNAIRSEYIGGGISQRELAAKHHISESTLLKRANIEGWTNLRKEAGNKSRIKAQQKTADAAASNAVLIEHAKSLALKRIIDALENMPDSGGSHFRQSVKKGDKNSSVDFDLLDLVTALERLERSGAASPTNELEDDALTKAMKEFAKELEQNAD